MAVGLCRVRGSGAPAGGVGRGLGREIEAFAVGLGEADAHVAPRDGEHEGDRFGRDMLDGEDEVALVLAVLVVGEDDHAARAQFGEDLVHR